MSCPDDSGPLCPASDESDEAEPPQRLTLTIVHEDGDWSAFGSPEEPIRRTAEALARHQRLELAPRSHASVALTSAAAVRRLNRAYRRKDAATNVLSFPYQPPPGENSEEASYLGDVVLAAETVRMEADERSIEPIHHLQHLVVHGVLHLLGYDHQRDSDAELMEKLEAEILATIGIADPYAAAVVSSSRFPGPTEIR